MDKRKQDLLSALVELYIKSAEPVGSKNLSETYEFDWSPATIRAELMDLEDEGYLTHPHTSAGRMPTEKGYRFYVDNLSNEATLTKRELAQLEAAYEEMKDIDSRLKSLAKVLADFSFSTAIVAQSPEKVYYTGIKNLFSQPEFSDDTERVAGMSAVLDALDEHLTDLFKRNANDVEVVIGRENPLSEYCSAVTVRVPRNESLMLLLGPMRMNYSRNISLLEKVRELMS